VEEKNVVEKIKEKKIVVTSVVKIFLQLAYNTEEIK